MFSFHSPQLLHFGRGQRHKALDILKSFGGDILVVHGASQGRVQWVLSACSNAGINTHTVRCASEPSLPDIETALHRFKGAKFAGVIAVGGGSVIDFAKAIAALIPCAGAARHYLEIVGDGRTLDHAPLPMIAVPTTAGTGAEVTKNAVITVPDQGLKVSLRDPRMVPDVAIVDADLMQGAPKHVTLSAGLDAVTQVIEPYLTRNANPMTDALCRAAIPTGLTALRAVIEHDDAQAWDSLAWVSTCGGLALANAGLGAVHGFAGVIGGMTSAPHGAICGALLPAVLRNHLELAEPGSDTSERLDWVMQQIDASFAEGRAGQGLEKMTDWAKEQGAQDLRMLGLSTEDHDTVASLSANASSMKGNPFALTQAQRVGILQRASA